MQLLFRDIGISHSRFSGVLRGVSGLPVLDEGVIRDLRLFLDGRPLFPRISAVDDSNDQEAERDQIRIKGFAIGSLLSVASFLLGMKSTERVQQRRLRGLKVPKWDRWLWLERLSCLGLFVGGFLMFLWPRIV